MSLTWLDERPEAISLPSLDTRPVWIASRRCRRAKFSGASPFSFTGSCPYCRERRICHPLGATAAAVTPLVSSFAATSWPAVRCERLVAKLILPGQDVLANHSHKEYLDMTLIVALFFFSGGREAAGLGRTLRRSPWSVRRIRPSPAFSRAPWSRRTCAARGDPALADRPGAKGRPHLLGCLRPQNELPIAVNLSVDHRNNGRGLAESLSTARSRRFVKTIPPPWRWRAPQSMLSEHLPLWLTSRARLS